MKILEKKTKNTDKEKDGKEIMITSGIVTTIAADNGQRWSLPNDNVFRFGHTFTANSESERTNRSWTTLVLDSFFSFSQYPLVGLLPLSLCVTSPKTKMFIHDH